MFFSGQPHLINVSQIAILPNWLPRLPLLIAEGAFWLAGLALGGPEGLAGQNRILVCQNGILVGLDGVLTIRIAFGSARKASWWARMVGWPARIAFCLAKM